MKKLMIAALMLTITFAANAQDSIPGKKKITGKNGQKARTDFLMHLDGVTGESPDTIPPAPGHLTISAGAMLSQTRNSNSAGGMVPQPRSSNLTEPYTVQSKPGFTFSIGYTLEFPKSRLQINAGYQKGGVSIAVGDINGDGKGNTTDVDLNYLSIPVQYQFYLGKSNRIFLGGGGYASLLLSSKQTGRPVYDAGFKKFDAGCTASAGIWLGSRLMLQSGYNYGLVDIDLSTNKKARNGMAFLMLQCSLSSKISYGPVITIKPKG